MGRTGYVPAFRELQQLLSTHHAVVPGDDLVHDGEHQDGFADAAGRREDERFQVWFVIKNDILGRTVFCKK